MSKIITKAVEILKNGGLVAFPTETVYGLGADALNDTAILAIFRAKERPLKHPLIVHIPDITYLDQYAVDVNEDVLKLAAAFWPGPLTLVLKKKATVSNLLTGDQETIGVRIPYHPIAQSLLQAFAGGIAAPSANRFTHVSPTSASAVFDELDGKVDLILDGGDCDVGLESTIVDMTSETPVILRPGMIDSVAIAKVLQKSVQTKNNTLIRTPGMHHLHYAPNTKTQLVTSDKLQETINHLSKQNSPIALMQYSKMKLIKNDNIEVITMPQNAKEYAHVLYQTLRRLDQEQFAQIIIERVPNEIEWEAILDRLMKATAAR